MKKFYDNLHMCQDDKNPSIRSSLASVERPAKEIVYLSFSDLARVNTLYWRERNEIYFEIQSDFKLTYSVPSYARNPR